MQIVYHLGAHCTDDERLARCLLKNRAALAAEGIVVPGPARYRNLLRDTAMQLRGGTPAAEAQAALLDQIIDGDGAERLILGGETFLGSEPAAVGAGLYPAGPERMAAFAGVFPDAGVELFLAIRNPATFLPALYGGLGGVVGALWVLIKHMVKVRDFDPIHTPWYVLNPFMGMVLGAITYFLLRATTFILGASPAQFGDPGEQFGLYFLSVVVGFNQNVLWALIDRVIKAIIPPESPPAATEVAAGGGAASGSSSASTEPRPIPHSRPRTANQSFETPAAAAQAMAWLGRTVGQSIAIRSWRSRSGDGSRANHRPARL